MKNKFLNKLFSSEAGATALEYGLIVAVVVLASVGALTAMSSTFILSLNDTSSKVSRALDEN